MITLNQFIDDATRAFNERHAAADSLLFNSAGFYHNGKRWQIEVRGQIVAEVKTFKEVRAFSAMHNNRLLGV